MWGLFFELLHLFKKLPPGCHSIFLKLSVLFWPLFSLDFPVLWKSLSCPLKGPFFYREVCFKNLLPLWELFFSLLCLIRQLPLFIFLQLSLAELLVLLKSLLQSLIFAHGNLQNHLSISQLILAIDDGTGTFFIVLESPFKVHALFAEKVVEVADLILTVLMTSRNIIKWFMEGNL